MCSVCRTNYNYTKAITDRLTEVIEGSKSIQAERDAYNAKAGPMDYDFDCCDHTYAELQNTIWDALKWLKIVEE